MSGEIHFNRGVVMRALRKAETRALAVYAEEVVARARAKAPVRKVTKQKRAKYKRASTLGKEYLAAAFAHRARMGFKNQAEATAYAKFLTSYARVRVQRRGVSRQPITLGRERQVKSKNVRTVGGGMRLTRRGRIINISGASVYMAPSDRFRAVRGVQGVHAKAFSATGERVHTFRPEGGFAETLTPRGRYEAKSGRAVGVNEAGQLVLGGRLKRSIEAYAPKESGRGMHAQVVATAPYAIYVEFPTSHNAAQPFLLPALHESKQHLKTITLRALEEAGLKKG